MAELTGTDVVEILAVTDHARLAGVDLSGLDLQNAKMDAAVGIGR
jgi:uncharacterized protein YjbI with pentapeptide repeats